MGIKLCCTKKRSNEGYQIASSDEKEIQKFNYKSSHDSQLDIIENKYNLLTYIQLIEYINLLADFSPSTATVPFEGILKNKFSAKDEFLNVHISKEEFQSFVENKLMKIQEIYELSGKNEVLVSTFRDSILQIYKSLETKLNQHFNEKIPDRIKKRNLIPLGILFCSSNNVSKIKLIFDLFKNENGLFCKSNESFDEFLLSCFLTSSYCLISARKSISDSNSSVPKLSIDEIQKMVETSELKDSENLVKVFNSQFFDKDEFNWEEFKSKFESKEGFGWILSSKGVRSKLEENNI